MAKLTRYLAGLSTAAYLALQAKMTWALPLNNQATNLTGGGNISNDINIIQTVFDIINWVLIVVGAFAVLFLIIGGFRYITSAGNETQVEGAKNTMTYAIIGLVIVLLAFVIASTINNLLLQ